VLSLRAHAHRLLDGRLAERQNGHHCANYGGNGQNLLHHASSIDLDLLYGGRTTVTIGKNPNDLFVERRWRGVIG
jgi:hypothetical protein